MIKKMVCSAIALVACCSAAADSLNGLFTVKGVFAENASTGGVKIVETNFSVSLFSLMYLNLSNETGEAIFSLLVSAKAAGWKINRIDYTVAPNGSCTVTGLHVYWRELVAASLTFAWACRKRRSTANCR